MGCAAERTDQTASLVRMADAQQLSQAAFDRLKAEYDDLTTRGRIDIARKIEAARELGDLSENGDYHAAKEEQGKMEGRIMHLGRMIENAVIVEAEVGGDSVMAGAIVTIVFDGDDEDDAERYLVGSIEEQADDVTVVSPGSPMGAALLGAAVGDGVGSGVGEAVGSGVGAGVGAGVGVDVGAGVGAGVGSDVLWHR